MGKKISNYKGCITTSDKQGNLYAAEYKEGRVVKINRSGKISVYVTGIDRPRFPIFDGKDNLYVGSYDGNIYKITPDKKKTVIARAIWSPQQMGLDAKGNLYVAGAYDGKIYEITPYKRVHVVAADFNQPNLLAVGDDGSLYIVDVKYSANKIIKVSLGIKKVFASFNEPISGVALHNGNLYVLHGDTVSKITAGKISTVVSKLNKPRCLTFYNNRLFISTLDGIIEIDMKNNINEDGEKGQALVDTTGMFESSGSVGGEVDIQQEQHFNSVSCRTLYQAYIADYNQMIQEIANENIPSIDLLKLLHQYRSSRQRYLYCTGKEEKSQRKKYATDVPTTERCGKEYISYQKSYEVLSEGINTASDLEFLRIRQRYLDDKKAYEACLNKKRDQSHFYKQKSNTVSNQRDIGKNSSDIIYPGSPIIKVLLSLKALSKTQPDQSTITDVIPDGKTPFYIFIYYRGMHTSDRLDLEWYIKKAGAKEQMLFENSGGHVPKSEGVIRGGPIQVEGGRFPAGEYRILLKINGKKAYEKFFRIRQ